MDRIGSVKVWINAFIPREIPGYTREVAGCPYAEQTMIPGPTGASKSRTRSEAVRRGTGRLWRTHSPLLVKAGLPRLNFHALRHTAATLLLVAGVHPRVVAERLGHSTPSVTLNVYSHVTPTMQREGATALDAVLGGSFVS